PFLFARFVGQKRGKSLSFRNEPLRTMGSKVLVLNQDYSAFSVCSVSKAFLLVYLNKAELVVHANDRVLRSVSQSFYYPVVIRLNHYIHRPYRGVMMTRQNIFRRD